LFSLDVETNKKHTHLLHYAAEWEPTCCQITSPPQGLYWDKRW
jgi:hypothetical protein